MKFINLTYPDNTDVWVSVTHIVAFARDGEATIVAISTGSPITVIETPTQILAKFP